MSRSGPGRRPPERTCVGCQRKAGKAELVRIVRTTDGRLDVDPSGKAAGRGAYVHPSANCIARAGKKGSIARALGTSLEPSEEARLVDRLTASSGGVG